MKFIFSIIVVLVLCLSVSAFADPDIKFLLYLDTGNRIHILGDSDSYGPQRGFNAYWGWERSGTFVSYVKDNKDGFEIKWNIDILGSACPDWYCLILKDSCYGMDIIFERQYGPASSSQVHFSILESLHFANYEEFLSDDNWGPAKYFLFVMLNRTKQDWHLPNMSIYNYFYEYPEPEKITPKIAHKCIELNNKLDDPNPQIRDMATLELIYSQYFIHLKEIAKQSDLSPEQYTRIEYILNSYPATDDWLQSQRDIIVSFVYHYFIKGLFAVDDWIRLFRAW